MNDKSGVEATNFNTELVNLILDYNNAIYLYLNKDLTDTLESVGSIYNFSDIPTDPDYFFSMPNTSSIMFWALGNTIKIYIQQKNQPINADIYQLKELQKLFDYFSLTTHTQKDPYDLLKLLDSFCPLRDYSTIKTLQEKTFIDIHKVLGDTKYDDFLALAPSDLTFDECTNHLYMSIARFGFPYINLIYKKYEDHPDHNIRLINHYVFLKYLADNGCDSVNSPIAIENIINFEKNNEALVEQNLYFLYSHTLLAFKVFINEDEAMEPDNNEPIIEIHPRLFDFYQKIHKHPYPNVVNLSTIELSSFAIDFLKIFRDYQIYYKNDLPNNFFNPFGLDCFDKIVELSISDCNRNFNMKINNNIYTVFDLPFNLVGVEILVKELVSIFAKQDNVIFNYTRNNGIYEISAENVDAFLISQSIKDLIFDMKNNPENYTSSNFDELFRERLLFNKLALENNNDKEKKKVLKIKI